MEVRFTKVSDAEHAVAVARGDGTREQVRLDSQSFLRHDLAHWAVELELGLDHRVWGSVAGGGSLRGEGLDGGDMVLSESVAGPAQTLMRTEAGPVEIAEVLRRMTSVPDISALAERLHERLRQLQGHWKATPYGGDMVLHWPLPHADLRPRSDAGADR